MDGAELTAAVMAYLLLGIFFAGGATVFNDAAPYGRKGRVIGFIMLLAIWPLVFVWAVLYRLGIWTDATFRSGRDG